MTQSSLNYELVNKQQGDSISPCLVLIHGLFGSLDNLAVIRRHFEDKYSVLSIDLPDHGKSYRSDTFSFDDYAQSICSLIQSLELTQVYLVGHSLGGKVAMLVAHKIPDIVKRLVVMDIAPVAYSPRHQNVLNGLNNVKLDQISDRKDAQKQLAEYVQDSGTQAFLLKSLYQNESGHWQWRFNVSLIEKDYDKLSAWTETENLYSGPTLFIKGAESDYILAEHQDTIMRQLPNASAKIVQAGHWLHAQKPQVINALITNFLPEKDN
ncbi:alpha/beta fold hydrolase [Glaciecola sp. 1036]|uniref:alpha/beta fold hydrolase n=1 Tax=Alteromonadaceae TaxID=72275 RepID=UPI003D060F43